MRDNYKDETKKYLKTVIKMLKDNNLLDKADESSLTLLADTYDLYLQCREDIEKNGLTAPSLHGLIVNPSATLQLRCTNTMMSILKEFGVSATARKRLIKNSETEDNSPIAQFLNKVKNED